MNTSNDVSNAISYLQQDTVNFQSSSDVISAVEILDRVSMIHHEIDQKVPDEREDEENDDHLYLDSIEFLFHCG